MPGRHRKGDAQRARRYHKYVGPTGVLCECWYGTLTIRQGGVTLEHDQAALLLPTLGFDSPYVAMTNE